jgi:hypothetical protein
MPSLSAAEGDGDAASTINNSNLEEINGRSETFRPLRALCE